MTQPKLERRREALQSLQRQHIIEAFAKVASEKGYAAATITDIVRLAQVSKATFYEHFADKEAVYAHLHSQVAAALHDALAASIARTAGTTDWRERIHDLVKTRLEIAASDPTFVAQAMIEPQIATTTARRIRAQAGRRSAKVWIQLSEEIAETTTEVTPIPEHIAVAGLSTGVEFITASASHGPDAIRALADHLTDVWIRLFRTP